MDLPNKQHKPGGEKTNYDRVVYGTKDGKLEFGKLNLAGNDENLSSSVTSGVHLQAYDSTHYMSMDIDGSRQGWTLQRSPGPHHILCASKTSGSEPGKTDGVGFAIIAENGDIIISAPKGRIRLSALDIDIRAEGPNTKRGSINLDSNQSVNIKTPTLDVNADIGVRIFTKGSLTLSANTTLKFISNFVEGLSSASSSTLSLANPLGIIEYIKNQSFL